MHDHYPEAKIPAVNVNCGIAEKMAFGKSCANRNKVSKSIGALMGQKKFEEAEATKKLVAEQAEELARCEALEGELNEKVNNIMMIIFLNDVFS